MPTSAGTEPNDVRVEIDTDLTDSEIYDTSGDDDGVLNRVEREIDRAYNNTSVTFQSTQHRQDFEAALAALRIAEGRDRRAENVSSGSSSVTYETREVENLRKRVRRDDPGSQFGRSATVVRDDGRHVSTTNN